MMKTENSEINKTSSRNPPLAKNMDASNLIGSIVEKGFSSTKYQKEQNQNQNSAPSSRPKFTTLPFPVARHRSHGPHWTPLGSEMNGGDDDDDKDKDNIDFDSVASFAHPIQRKKKKDLDFSKWRELVSRDCSDVTHEKKEENLVLVECGEGKEERGATENVGERTKLALPNTDAFIHKNLNGEPHTNSTLDLSKGVETVPSDLESYKFENSEQGSLSFMSNIDAENCALLQTSHKDDGNACQDAGYNNFEDSEKAPFPFMSDIDVENHALIQKMTPEEIAEAQAEIMEKMQPGMLEMLKKRGQDKIRKQKTVATERDTRCQRGPTHDINDLQQDSKRAAVLDGAETSHMVETTHTKHACSGPDNGGWPSSGVRSSSSWSAWTDRVEKVRALRFSLEGSVLENDSVQVPTIGDHAENVTERDFLRTEGDPGGAGYTFKEAITLIRSMIPGQRALALQLLASVLHKSLCNLQQSKFAGNMGNVNHGDKFVDWQAVWAFALGPEAELVLSLRISLDDNHISVVLAGLKVIQCLLSCDMNEDFFNLSEKLITFEKDIYTAPVFRSRPEIGVGFLGGGFWKYSTKPLNIIPFGDEKAKREDEGKHTIQDDVFVAGQDVAAGLVRMGILPRICYLLEMYTVAALDESLVSVLIGLARHSQACANAIIQCPRLIQTVVNRFIKNATMKIHPSTIKSVALLKVLAKSDQKNCKYFITHGIFQDTMRHMYKYTFSLDHWIKSGNEYCKLTSALMVEQLRLWKVCISYGYCISYFAEFFPTMCFWMSPPTFDKLIENNVLSEYTSVTIEAYLTLEALARRLPYLHSEEQLKSKSMEFSDGDMESWSWSHVVPMIELAIQWIALKNNPYLSLIFSQHGTTYFDVQGYSISCLLWVISAVLHMLSTIFERITPSLHESSNHVPWLPEFIPKIGLEIVKNGFLNLLGTNYEDRESFPTIGVSVVEDLCHLRHHNDYETALSSVFCLYGLVRLIFSVDKSIKIARCENRTSQQGYSFVREGKILEDGIAMSSRDELKSVLIMFMNLVALEWNDLQSIEMFSRGGPAPGIGLGWGASGGGFWSTNILLAQMDAHLIVDLVHVFLTILEKDLPAVDNMNFTLQMINSALGACLVAGPRNAVIVEKALGIFLRAPVLMYLDFCIRSFLSLKGIKSLRWEYKNEDYIYFGKILNSHFRNRWLSVKKKSTDKRNSKSADDKRNPSQKDFEMGDALDTIHEELDESEMTNHDLELTSLIVEWAHQRLPLPVHWFLSPISTTGDDKGAPNLPNAANPDDRMCSSKDVLDVPQSGLFLLLGLEAMSSFSCSDVQCSPIQSVPLVWKLHALSMVLLVQMDLLEEEQSRDMYGTLQVLYGQLLDQSRCGSIKFALGENKNSLPENGMEYGVEFLKFKTDIHESYNTFVETLVEQFSSISYGDVIFGRQVALYLHRSVEVPVRLAAWKALTNAHVLELLPPIGKCFAKAEGYLEPVEDNEEILEAYVKSWMSGGLEKAAARGSISFTLALHHLSSFIFHANTDNLSLRKKLTRSLLRDHSRKQHHKDMIMSFVRYTYMPATSQEPELKKVYLRQTDEIKRRFELLSEACEGNSSLLAEVEKLKILLSEKENFLGFSKRTNE
ncbi:RPAP1-like, carboxy-terminal protein [Tasmannia lanceolata]|uniref:RPAP1-like, carboxy-terminal protein n=1 Tax=Tasmannia lanceolata TaxID=3420 RepID=UPI00406491E2